MPAPQWFRWRWEQIGNTGILSLDELLARLDRCLGSECEHLVEGVCVHGQSSPCKRRERWFERLTLGLCQLATDKKTEHE
jgi:hypothetical protein